MTKERLASFEQLAATEEISPTFLIEVLKQEKSKGISDKEFAETGLQIFAIALDSFS